MSQDSGDLDSLINSTLNAFGSPSASSTPPSASSKTGSAGEVVGNDNVDDILTRLKSVAAPKVAETSSDSPEDSSNVMDLLESLLSPEAIVDSMGALAVEMEKFLADKDSSYPDMDRFQKQLSIYKEVSTAHSQDPDILEAETPEGERVRARIEELQSLGSPPDEVVQLLMASQLGEGSGVTGGLQNEFEQFLKEAGNGGLLPGLSKEDEEIIMQLSQDPSALKNLLEGAGGGGSGKPGECSIM